MLASGELGRLASTTRTAGSLSKLTDRLAKCSPCEQPTHVITDDVRRLQRLLQLQCHACRLTSSLQLTQPAAPRCPLIDGPSILTRYQRRVCFVSLASHLPLSCADRPGAAGERRSSYGPACVFTHQRRLETRPDIKRASASRRLSTDRQTGGAQRRGAAAHGQS